MRKFLTKNDKVIPINTDADRKMKTTVRTNHPSQRDMNFLTDGLEKFGNYFIEGRAYPKKPRL